MTLTDGCSNLTTEWDWCIIYVNKQTNKEVNVTYQFHLNNTDFSLLLIFQRPPSMSSPVQTHFSQKDWEIVYSRLVGFVLVRCAGTVVAKANKQTNKPPALKQSFINQQVRSTFELKLGRNVKRMCYKKEHKTYKLWVSMDTDYLEIGYVTANN